MPQILLFLYLAILNPTAFFVYGLDKSYARRRHRRRDQLDRALADGFPEGVDVVGEPAHQVASAKSACFCLPCAAVRSARFAECSYSATKQSTCFSPSASR